MKYGARSADDGGGGEKCPPGFYRAVLVGIFDIGKQPPFKSTDSPQHKVILAWEVDARDSKGRNFVVFDTLALYLSTKPSKLSERFGALLGRPLTDKECEDGLDDAELLGKTVMVFIAPPSGNSKWPKVQQALPLQAGQSPMRASKMFTEADPPKVVRMAREKAIKPGAPPSIASPAPTRESGGDEIPF